MKTNVFFIMMLFMAVAFGFISCGNAETKKENMETKHNHKEGEAHHSVYQCAMHCEQGKTYDKPGKCPVCNKDLKEVHEHEEGHGHNHKEGDGHSH